MKHPRILIADDELDCTGSLERRLRRRGYTVLKSISRIRDLPTALRRLGPDAVLLDVFFRVEKQNALFHLPKLRTACPRTVFIINTGIDDGELVELALANGAKGFLTKYDGVELFAAIEAALIGEIYISSSMRPLVADRTPRMLTRPLTLEEERLFGWLHAGWKQVSIAKELGLSRRTFERRVKALAKALGLDHSGGHRFNWQAVRHTLPPLDPGAPA